jgi:hypothetical protein
LRKTATHFIDKRERKSSRHLNGDLNAKRAIQHHRVCKAHKAESIPSIPLIWPKGGRLVINAFLRFPFQLPMRSALNHCAKHRKSYRKKVKLNIDSLEQGREEMRLIRKSSII